MKTKELFAVLVAIVSLSSCGPVIDVNSIDRGKINQEVQNMNAVEGTYTGSLTTKKNGQTAGSASLHLDSDKVIYTGPSDPRSQLRAQLRGTLEIQFPERKLSVTFNESYFDDKTQDLVVGYNPGNNAPGFKLVGKQSGGTIIGEIYATGFPHEGFGVNLSVNGPANETNASIVAEGASATILEHIEKKYRLESQSVDSEPILIVSAHSLTHEEEFLRILLPYQPVRISRSIHYGKYMQYPNAKWDSKSGILRGEYAGSLEGQLVTHTIECISTSTKSGRLAFPDSLDCTAKATNRGEPVAKYKLISN